MRTIPIVWLAAIAEDGSRTVYVQAREIASYLRELPPLEVLEELPGQLEHLAELGERGEL